MLMKILAMKVELAMNPSQLEVNILKRASGKVLL
jgi:hypothetical protein